MESPHRLEIPGIDQYAQTSQANDIDVGVLNKLTAQTLRPYLGFLTPIK